MEQRLEQLKQQQQQLMLQLDEVNYLIKGYENTIAEKAKESEEEVEEVKEAKMPNEDYMLIYMLNENVLKQVVVRK